MIGVDGSVGYPDVGRAGLGNMLFPWARCVKWCTQNDRPMLAPAWRTFRVGPWLRGERDRRQYHRVLGPGEGITGWRRLRALAFLPRTDEHVAVAATGRPSRLVVFRGPGRLFADLAGHHEMLRKALMRCIEQRAHLPHSDGRPFVAVHVRLGDFGKTDPARSRRGDWNVRLPIDWYVNAVQAIRSKVGDVEARVFSDGEEHELQPLLALPNTTFSCAGAAPYDLWTISTASALVASGSTFSMWASFLGQVPTVWYPGQRRALLLGEDGKREPEWDAVAPLPQEFIAGTRARAAIA